MAQKRSITALSVAFRLEALAHDDDGRRTVPIGCAVEAMLDDGARSSITRQFPSDSTLSEIACSIRTGYTVPQLRARFQRRARYVAQVKQTRPLPAA
jgi:hypothetical protein